MYEHHFHLFANFNLNDDNIDNMKFTFSTVENDNDDNRFWAEKCVTFDDENYFSSHIDVYAPSFDFIDSTFLCVHVYNESLYEFIKENFPYIKTWADSDIVRFDLTHWSFTLRNSNYQLVATNCDCAD